MVTPCKPSAPPVSQPYRLANSRSTSATPSVTIRRVRSEPRNTRKLVTKPSAVAAHAGDQQGQHRLVDDSVLGQQRGGIGAEAEKGGMAERDDAGIAEDQIERKREQAEPGDLGQDEMPARQQVDRGKGGDPEHDFERLPAGAGGQPLGGGADGIGERSHGARLSATPRGRTSPAAARSARRS